MLTLKALCADKPLSRGGFLRMKLEARLRATACCRSLSEAKAEAAATVGCGPHPVAAAVAVEEEAVPEELEVVVLVVVEVFIAAVVGEMHALVRIVGTRTSTGLCGQTTGQRSTVDRARCESEHKLRVKLGVRFESIVDGMLLIFE